MDQGSSTRESWAALRNASSAAQLAVSMLVGPLAPWRDPAPTAEQLREILAALDATTRQINALVRAMAPAALASEASAANGPMVSVGIVDAPRIVAQVDAPRIVAQADAPRIVAQAGAPRIVAQAAASPSPAQSSSGTRSSDRPRTATGSRRTESSSPRPARAPHASASPSPAPALAPENTVDVGELLRQVAVDASLHPDFRLEVSAAAGLRCSGDREVMLAVLGRLVRDAAAMGPMGAIVDVRAYAELSDALGDEMDAVIEVRPDARAAAGQGFVADPGELAPERADGLRLELHGRGGRPRARLRAAMATQARILAA